MSSDDTKTAGIHVLVVDDDPDICHATARVLRRAGFPVEEAVSGEDCLSLLEEKSFDLVLLDVVLPGIDGREVCGRIKSDERLSGTYVVLISGSKTSSDDRSEGLETGSDGYIVRPVANRELLAWTESMARIIHAERERDQLIEKLQGALERIETLQGLLSICSNCKKIRNDDGSWTHVESYVRQRSKAEFSHGLCEDCAAELYPDVDLSSD